VLICAIFARQADQLTCSQFCVDSHYVLKGGPLSTTFSDKHRFPLQTNLVRYEPIHADYTVVDIHNVCEALRAGRPWFILWKVKEFLFTTTARQFL
jgi:hypothetical protein